MSAVELRILGASIVAWGVWALWSTMRALDAPPPDPQEHARKMLAARQDGCHCEAGWWTCESCQDYADGLATMVEWVEFHTGQVTR